MWWFLRCHRRRAEDRGFLLLIGDACSCFYAVSVFASSRLLSFLLLFTISVLPYFFCSLFSQHSVSSSRRESLENARDRADVLFPSFDLSAIGEVCSFAFRLSSTRAEEFYLPLYLPLGRLMFVLFVCLAGLAVHRSLYTSRSALSVCVSCFHVSCCFVFLSLCI